MTAQGLIDLTLGDVINLAPGEAVSADDYAYCLSRLNLLIASLNAQVLPIHQITKRIGLLSNGAYGYFMGPGMTWNFARPMKIKAAISSYSLHNEPVRIVTAEEFAVIAADRSATSFWVKAMTYNNGYPTGLVTVWPIPNVLTPGLCFLEMDVYDELATLATLTTAIALPPGYERMLACMLAPEIAGTFGRPVTEVMMALATDAKSSVFGLNQAIHGHPAGPQAAQPPQ